MRFSRYLAVSLLLLSLPLRAEVLVLVHGYLGSAHSWQQAGVLDILMQRGHRYAGNFYFAADGVRLIALDSRGERPLYTAELPSLAPLNLQADWLSAYLREIVARHPGQPVVLAGHSAGGVAARLALVRQPQPAVSQLITIASPHFGTWRAAQALDATHHAGLFSPAKRWAVRRSLGSPVYQLLLQSRPVLRDLAPPRPGNLLFWLNQQPHPPIDYISIIRTGTAQNPGDPVVPPASQDLRRVPGIGRRAQSYIIDQGHLLGPSDGHLLANLLDMNEEQPAKQAASAATGD